MKSKWLQPPGVNGIKIFDNDDQATKYYCYLTLKLQALGRQQ